MSDNMFTSLDVLAFFCFLVVGIMKPDSTNYKKLSESYILINVLNTLKFVGYCVNVKLKKLKVYILLDARQSQILQIMESTFQHTSNSIITRVVYIKGVKEFERLCEQTTQNICVSLSKNIKISKLYRALNITRMHSLV